MCHFDADGKRYYPFGRGSGSEACISFPNINFFRFLNHIYDLNIKQFCNVYDTCLTVWSYLQVVQQFGIPHLFDLPIRPTVRHLMLLCLLYFQHFFSCLLSMFFASWYIANYDLRTSWLYLKNCQLSASGDSGMPEVVADPQGDVSKIFQNLGVCVVQQCAKIRQQGILFQ